MIRQVAILLAVAITVHSQRPPYAGSSKPYPGVLPQYLEEQAVAVAAAAPSTTAGSTLSSVKSRIDASDASTLAESAVPTTIITPTLPPDLPVDARGDIDLINRIKTWPRDKQPFWYINWQQIQEHRGDTKNRAQPPQTEPNARSFFAG